MRRIFTLLLALPVFVQPAFANEPAFSKPVPVAYFDAETELEGVYVAANCDDNSKELVLIVPQWKGISAHETEVAEKLASQCYNTFIVDMYGKGVRPKDNAEAGALAGKYKGDVALALGRLNAALEAGKKQANPEKIVIMGYCFGGTMALELARSGADLAGAVSFHGGLSTPAPVKETGIIKAPILVHHGDIDPMVPPAEVNAFLEEMRGSGATYEFTAYSGAVHAFTHKDAGNDISNGVAYNQRADERSWLSTQNFLRKAFDE